MNVRVRDACSSNCYAIPGGKPSKAEGSVEAVSHETIPGTFFMDFQNWDVNMTVVL